MGRVLRWNLELIWALEAGGPDEPGALWAGTVHRWAKPLTPFTAAPSAQTAPSVNFSPPPPAVNVTPFAPAAAPAK